MRRKDKLMDDPKELDRVLKKAKYITIAMIDHGHPYLVTLSHGYDAAQHCIYFHCAGQGRKIDALIAAPEVYGQALDDLGYVAGSCDHKFETVQFEGRVSFVNDPGEKRHGLEVMIRQLEPDPETVIAAQTQENSLAKVTIGRIDLGNLSGKRAVKPVVQL